MKAERVLLRLFEDVRTGILGLGDDVDALKVGEVYLVTNVDGFAAKGVMLEFMDLKDVGWRGVTACLSDLVAKLVRPSALQFSVYGLTFSEVKEISEGVKEALNEYDLTFLGADTNSGEPAIDVFCFGFSEREPPRLSGAEPGDAVVLPQGCWGCINRCLRGEFWEHCKRPRVDISLVERLKPYAADVHASTDSSDGLAISLYRIAEASGVRIRLEEPPPGPLGEEGFYGGEEYLPVLVVKKETAEEVAGVVKGRVVGFVERGNPSVVYRGKPLRLEGWEWF